MNNIEPAADERAKSVTHLFSPQLEQWPIERLVPYVRNPRKNDHAVQRMVQAIETYGFKVPIVAHSVTGEVVDGHLRLKAAVEMGLTSVPVIPADDLSPSQIKGFRLLANSSASWAQWDDELLALELAELDAAGYDLDLTGFDSDEILEILAGEETTTEGQTDEDAVPESTGPVVSVPGILWVCGNHSVLCDDATNANAYTTLLGDDVADAVFTDPPYNVNYANSMKNKLRGKNRAILNDNLGSGFYEFLLASLTPMLAHCSGGIYVAMSSSELDTLQRAFRAAGGHWSTFIIWSKSSFTLGRADYQRQYEPLLYGWREGAERHWCGDRDQSDVWQIKKPHRNDLHPMMKPVELVERAIRNSSQPDDVVLDPFGGSGTTMIAAEKAGRHARLMELDPKYVDTIVRRWQDYTGQKATRQSDGVPFDTLMSAAEGLERGEPAAEVADKD